MKLTPLDIQQQSFTVTLRGYSRVEVTDFLEAICRNYESLLAENEALREGLAEAREENAALKEREGALQNCLVTAREMAEDVVAKARKEADLIHSEAELNASRLMHLAEEKATELRLDLGDLRRQKRHLQAQLRSVLDHHRSLLDAVEVSSEEMVEEAPKASLG